MRVLVTGHNGYIGSVMVPILRGAGHDIVGLDTFFFEDCVLGDAPGTVQAIRKDIRDMQVSDLEVCAAVVHLAVLCNDPLGDLNQDWTYDVNHHASVHLARLSREAGVRRFLYASSCSMYAAAGSEILNETAPLRPLTAYAVSKVRTEEDVSKVEYAEGGGLDPRSYRVDFSKLGRVLPEFRPQWNASFGAKDLYAALQDAEVTLADFQGPKYIRLTQIRHLLDSGRLDGSLRWTRSPP